MNPDDDSRLQLWQAAWPEALALWSRYTRLSDPYLCQSRVEAAAEGLTSSFAMIRLSDQRVVIDLQQTKALGLDAFAVDILAHEVGHHVLAPASARDHFRLIARIRHALPTLESHAPLIANLYTDLLINDRLQRRMKRPMDAIYRAIVQQTDSRAEDGLWALYMAIYERLWQLPKGSLGGGQSEQLLADAWLGSRLIRVYANDWLDASGRFASLLLPYLVDQEEPRLDLLHDTRDAGKGSHPAAVHEREPAEQQGSIHPACDPRITGDDEAVAESEGSTDEMDAGQMREPFEYGEILRAAGVDLSDHDIAIRYYREHALPHLVRYPRQRQPHVGEYMAEGSEVWEISDALEELDVLQSLIYSPRVLPGLTTRKWHYGYDEGRQPASLPVDLDLYVDSSGSMPDPQQQISWLALAGAVVALSALRAGARVQVTRWSGKQQYLHTQGFTRDEQAILGTLTGYLGGATAFPIHRLRETYAGRSDHERAVHLLVISDDGVTTLFDEDEQGNSGWDVARMALERGRGGATMALELSEYLQHHHAPYLQGVRQTLARARDTQGWDIHFISQQSDFLAFAGAFSRRHYQVEEAQ